MQTNFEPAKHFAPSAVLRAQSVALAPLENKKQTELKSAQRFTGEPLIYAPHYLRGGAKHPGLIVKTSGLANVASPITYRPHLPHELNAKKLISEIQFERVIYAGQAHAQLLPNGARAGISIGDGTGTDKTGALAGIILDN